MSLLSWLQSLANYPKVYWKERSSSRAFAAAGFGSSSNQSYGWRLFTPTMAPHWADFPSRFLFSPSISREAEVDSTFEFSKPIVKSLSYAPGKEAWISLVEKTLDSIRKKEINKIVLGRECTLQLEKPVDPWPLVAAIQKKAANAYVFCIQPTPRSAFLGATPERLFFRQGNALTTEALAGTRKLGSVEEHDLLHHPKDRREFSFVEDSIREALSPLTNSPFVFSTPSVRATSFVQHLYSQLKAELKSKTTDSKILDRLHPTGALSGFPKKQAMSVLKKLEPFDRGLYGAPIGRMDGEESEWIVGIRSCLLFESTARLYSGTGIVEGSDPLNEWDELDSKLGLYEGIFL